MDSRFLLVPLLALCAQAAPAPADQSWHFRLTPYLWFAGLKGDVATIPGAPSAPIDISASDALEDTEASLMVILDAKKGRHGLFADLLYSDVRTDDELVPPPISLVLRSTSKTTIFTLGYQYEIFNRDRAVVDLMAGARYWQIDSKLRFNGGLGILGGRKISNSESWIDPALGIKGRTSLGSSPFYLEGGAGIGGFGVGSDLFYELSASIGYQWSEAIGTAIGYRMFDVDYEDDGYLYDVRQQGWQLGLTWAF